MCKPGLYQKKAELSGTDVVIQEGSPDQWWVRCPVQVKTYSSSPQPYTHLSGSESTEKVFFGSHHVKSDCDWCGGAVQWNVPRNIAVGIVTVQGAHDVSEHCSLTVSLRAQGVLYTAYKRCPQWASRATTKKKKLTCRLGGGYIPDPSSSFHSCDTASPALCTRASIRIISWVSTPLQDTHTVGTKSSSCKK